MTDRNDVEKLERIREQVTDSVLELSDEAILAEFSDVGADPHAEAERVRFLLRQVLDETEVVNDHQTNNKLPARWPQR